MDEAEADAGKAEKDDGIEEQHAAIHRADVLDRAEEDIDGLRAAVIGLIGFGF